MDLTYAKLADKYRNQRDVLVDAMNRIIEEDANGTFEAIARSALAEMRGTDHNGCVSSKLKFETAAFELEGKLLTILRLADELTSALDNEAEDIGGQRPSGVIIRELGPAVDAANEAVEKVKDVYSF